VTLGRTQYAGVVKTTAGLAAVAVAAALTLAILGPGRAQERSTSRDFRVSASVSPFIELRLRNGVAFTDGTDTAKTPQQLQSMFAKHGANEVYARIATTQKYRSGFGDHSMDRGLERARIAKALNLPLNPELGLFNVYAIFSASPHRTSKTIPKLKFRLPGHPSLSIKCFPRCERTGLSRRVRS
jgi:hypothetical protein